MIRTALDRGRWVRLYSAVYRLGLLPAPLEAEMAAVLACRGGAVLSHRTAASLWGILPRPRGRPDVDVTALRGRPRSRTGLYVHRSRGLAEAEHTTLDGLPITSPARTILDLAVGLPLSRLERVVAKALRAEICDERSLRRIVDRHRRRAGTAALREVLRRSGGPVLTRSVAESRFLALLRAAEIEPPRTNAPLEGYEVDFFWPGARLVVEIDGRAYHGSSAMFERDRRRDAAMIGAGYRVQRFTWHQLTDKPEVVLVRVAQALAWRG